MVELYIPSSIGELTDKISILEIKLEKIKDQEKLANIQNELALLYNLRTQINLNNYANFDFLTQKLRSKNEQIWEAEDKIRELEKNGDFKDSFIQVARTIHRLNDERAALKKMINLSTGSTVIEEKSYCE